MSGIPTITPLTLAVLLAAAPVPVEAGKGDEPFPGYDSLCGYPLVMSSTASVAQARLGRDGQPVIVLDPQLSGPDESHRRVFLIAHECAHHRMGHVAEAERRKRTRSRRVVRDHELSADCWAAETLAQARMDRTLRVIEDRFFRGGLYSPGGGYPAGIQRASIIRACAESGRNRSKAASLTPGADAAAAPEWPGKPR